MDRELLEAVIIDFVSLIFYGGVLSMISNPPLGISSRQLMFVGLLFPVSAYVLTYKRYTEYFWKAFFGSVILGAALLLGGFWLYANMVI